MLYSSSRLWIKDRKILTYLLVLFICSYTLRYIPIAFVSDHISNFALSGILLILVTFSELLKKGLSQIAFMSVLAIGMVANIVTELFINQDVIELPGELVFTNFNTADPLDAVFGVVGVSLFGYVVMRYAKITHKKVPSKR